MKEIQPSEEFKKEFTDNKGFSPFRDVQSVESTATPADQQSVSVINTELSPKTQPASPLGDVQSIRNSKIFFGILLSSLFSALALPVITLVGFVVLTQLISTGNISSQLSPLSLVVSLFVYVLVAGVLIVVFFARQLQKRAFVNSLTAHSTALLSFAVYSTFLYSFAREAIGHNMLYVFLFSVFVFTLVSTISIFTQEKIFKESRIVSMVNVAASFGLLLVYIYSVL